MRDEAEEDVVGGGAQWPYACTKHLIATHVSLYTFLRCAQVTKCMYVHIVALIWCGQVRRKETREEISDGVFPMKRFRYDFSWYGFCHGTTVFYSSGRFTGEGSSNMVIIKSDLFMRRYRLIVRYYVCNL